MAGKGEGGSHPRMSAGYPGSPTGHEGEHQGLKESAQEMASQLGEGAEQAKDKAAEFVSRATGRAEAIWEDAFDFVRRYPLASLAVAFGLGCLASAAVLALSRTSTDDLAKRMSQASS